MTLVLSSIIVFFITKIISKFLISGIQKTEEEVENQNVIKHFGFDIIKYLTILLIICGIFMPYSLTMIFNKKNFFEVIIEDWKAYSCISIPIFLMILYMIYLHNWQILVNKEYFVYRNFWGISKRYAYEDIKKIEYCKNSIKIYVGRQKIDIEYVCEFDELVSIAKKRGVTIKKYIPNSTIYNAIIRPPLVGRVIYIIMGGICVLLSGYLLIVYGNELSNIGFFGLIVMIFIGIYLIIEMIIEKIIVDGNNITYYCIKGKDNLKINNITRIVNEKDKNGHLIIKVFYKKKGNRKEKYFRFVYGYDNSEFLVERLQKEKKYHL